MLLIMSTCAHAQVAETHWDKPGGQKEAEQRLEDDAVNMIIERLLDAKPSLYWHFTRQVFETVRLNLGRRLAGLLSL